MLKITSQFDFQTLATTSVPATLSQAYARYNELIFTHTTAPEQSTVVTVQVDDLSEDYPQLETDESYSLDITDASVISLKAKTVYGALRGLESLSQLVLFDFDTQEFSIPGSPISIQDAPRYNHRGLLLDTSRHYQPIASIKRTIDALSYAKYNVFHWHVVDTESFPFESLTYPKLWNGAYTSREKYTQSDVKDVVEYARLRGIKVHRLLSISVSACYRLFVLNRLTTSCALVPAVTDGSLLICLI